MKRIHDKKQMDLMDEQTRIWLINTRQRVVEIAKRKGTVSADEVREAFPIPGWINRNTMGKLFKSKEFIFTGIKKSSTPSRKGGLICTYGLSESVRNL